MSFYSSIHLFLCFSLFCQHKKEIEGERCHYCYREGLGEEMGIMVKDNKPHETLFFHYC